MSYGGEGVARMRVLQVVVLIVFGVIAARLAYIQLIDSKYEELARGNALRYEVQYPSRGEVFDRNGEYLVQSRECYDLMVIYREMDREGFDTTHFCQVTGLSHEGLVRELANARVRPRAPRMVMNYMSKEDKLRFDECNFAGFYTVYRTARQYPRKVGGNLLGYVGEVNSEMLRRYPSYQAGEYVGISGVESAYEPELRGKKGVKISEVDTHGAIKGSYMDGRFDSLPVPVLMTGESFIQEVLFFPQMRPEKVVPKDAPARYTELGIPEDWVAVIQKAGYNLVSDMKDVNPQKLHMDICGINKKYKLELANPTVNEVADWVGRIKN